MTRTPNTAPAAVRSRAALHRIERVLYIVGALLLGFWGGAHVATGVSQFAAREWMDALEETHPIDGTLSATDDPVPAATARGLVGQIEIARLDLSAMVVEGTSTRALFGGVGHLTDSALPGAAGNVVLAAHRDTFFRPLERVRQGDLIQLKTVTGSFAYRVETISIVEPTQTDVLAPTEEPVLTLVTCYPFRFIGPAPKRFIVRAVLVSGPREETTSGTSLT